MNPLQVAVGVIKNPAGKILISLRHASLHQGDLWEFPGGKIEATETARLALARELKEELNITVTAATPLITVNHHYPDLSVRLNVFLVEQFSGEAKSCVGQPFKWVAPAELEHYAFPAANRPIITAARLPHYYAILDDADPALLLTNLQKILNRGVKLIQARLKNLPSAAVALRRRPGPQSSSARLAKKLATSVAGTACRASSAISRTSSSSSGISSRNREGVRGTERPRETRVHERVRYSLRCARVMPT